MATTAIRLAATTSLVLLATACTLTEDEPTTGSTEAELFGACRRGCWNGDCDRATLTCVCDPGWTGRACDLATCDPTDPNAVAECAAAMGASPSSTELPNLTCSVLDSAPTGVCLPRLETECGDGADEDEDGLVDCDDPDCNAAAECATCPETVTIGSCDTGVVADRPSAELPDGGSCLQTTVDLCTAVGTRQEQRRCLRSLRPFLGPQELRQIRRCHRIAFDEADDDHTGSRGRKRNPDFYIPPSEHFAPDIDPDCEERLLLETTAQAHDLDACVNVPNRPFNIACAAASNRLDQAIAEIECPAECPELVVAERYRAWECVDRDPNQTPSFDLWVCTLQWQIKCQISF